MSNDTSFDACLAFSIFFGGLYKQILTYFVVSSLRCLLFYEMHEATVFLVISISPAVLCQCLFVWRIFHFSLRLFTFLQLNSIAKVSTHAARAEVYGFVFISFWDLFITQLHREKLQMFHFSLWALLSTIDMQFRLMWEPTFSTFPDFVRKGTNMHKK